MNKPVPVWVLLLLAFATVVLSVSTFIALHHIDSQLNQPSCPTEDSCQVRYEDERWTVTEEN